MTVRIRIVLKLVNRRFKLVALMLTLAVMGTPLAALANCNPKFAVAGHCGGEHCPMMMHMRQAAGTQVSEMPTGDGSCCRISGLPVSVAKPAVPTQMKAYVLSPTAQTVVAMVPVTFSPADGPPAPVLVPSSSPQAVLCTFLV